MGAPVRLIALQGEVENGQYNPAKEKRTAGKRCAAKLNGGLNYAGVREKITLRCGKSSITLYPNGKVMIKGEYIFTDAEGTNRIAGGRVELN